MTMNYKEKIWCLLRTTQNKPKQRNRDYCKRMGLSPQEALLIREVAEYKEGVTTGELSRLLGLSKSTISSMVNRLEDSGIITREIPKDNRRITLLKISPGYIDRPEAQQLRRELIEGLFSKITETDAEIIIRGLELLNERMNIEEEENQ